MDDGQDQPHHQTPLDLTMKGDGDTNLANVAMLLAMQGQISEYGQFMPQAPQEQNKEKERIADRLNGFNPKDNIAWREITNRFGNNIKQPELLSIAQVLASSANIKLDRDAKRRKTVLIKWFLENWSAIQPFLDFVVLEDAHV